MLSIPSNDAWLHAPWWSYNEAEDFGEMGALGACMLLGEVMMNGISDSIPCEGLLEKELEISSIRENRVKCGISHGPGLR